MGLERAGMETVAFCEIEPYPRKVLAKHWPNIPIYDDVRTLTKERLDSDGIGSIDVICGGYPCQPFSVAGKREGAEDDRHLWPEYFRLIREINPSWIIAENVYGHVTMGLDVALSDLESIGYTWETFVIPACAVGAPHRRDRVWIVAHSEQPGRLDSTQSNEEGQRQSGAHTDEALSLWPASDTGRPGGKGFFQESFQGFPAFSWCKDVRGIKDYFGRSDIPEPLLRRISDGIPGGVDRLKGLGNAVVPQIPEIIGRAIMSINP